MTSRMVEAPVSNQLLPMLPLPARVQLMSSLEPVQLDRQQVLFRAHEPVESIYFPSTAVISLVCHVESGQSLEVGLIGRDGVAGVTVCPEVTSMACDAVTQIAGAAHRIDAHVLRRKLRDDPALHAALGRYAELLFVRGMHMSVCNMFHSAEQRCIRWLLSVHDVIAQDVIPLTHELLATMLGVHRPTVTLVLGALQRAGLLEEERGRIVISNRRRLERASCECYHVMREEQRRLLGY
jgi:CRP-like cAMP-binding protein